MSNALLESLWARVDTNIGSRIAQISELLTQALSANTESTSARDTAVAAEQTATTAANNAASSESEAKSAETAASGHAQVAQTSATEAVDAKNRAVEIAGGDFATLDYVNNTVADALRVDTSVGTRVFMGDQLIISDTGLRIANDLAEGLDFTNASHHRMTIRRVGNQVFFEAMGVRSVKMGWVTSILPSGFRPPSGMYNALLGTVLYQGQLTALGNSNTMHRLSVSNNWPEVGDTLTLNATWFTNDSWPTALPGTPA